MTPVREFESLAKRRIASVLSADPPVAAAYESDFESRREAFESFAKANKGATILLQLGYEHETPELAAKLAGAIALFKSAAPDARAIVLCNSPAETAALGALGVEVRFVHQNCFLDERRYSPIERPRIYDAAYIARLTPCKRHELVPRSLGPRLLLMGCDAKIYESERPYADMVARDYASARRIGVFSGAKISDYLAAAKCGLVLSAREGASFCSSEYLLCGLPVVDTPAMGGRNVLYPAEYVKYASATRESVGEAIEFWKERQPERRLVRAAWLAKAAVHRKAFSQLMRELTGRPCARAPHKLGIRTPHPGVLHSAAIAAYLAFRRKFPARF